MINCDCQRAPFDPSFHPLVLKFLKFLNALFRLRVSCALLCKSLFGKLSGEVLGSCDGVLVLLNLTAPEVVVRGSCPTDGVTCSSP